MGTATMSAAKAAEKWTRKASASTQDYADGVSSPRTSWSAAAKAAEDNYKQGVTAAAQKGSFGKGVLKAGDATWSQGCQVNGTQRWAPGIANAEQKFASGIQGVLSTVAGCSLPPRGVKGDPRNLERVRIIANALHAKKIA